MVMVGGVGWFVFQQKTVVPAVPVVSELQTTPEAPAEVIATSTASSTTPASSATQAPSAATAPATVTIVYNGDSFTPAKVIINKNDTVTFVNQNGGRMWVAADEHPGHVEYDQTDKNTHCAADYVGPTPFDQCGTGDSYSFTFTKSGTFDYHNHSAAQLGGTVTVK
jgi:plastocyanin